MASSGRLRLFFFFGGGGGVVILVSLLRTKFEKKNTLNRNDSWYFRLFHPNTQGKNAIFTYKIYVLTLFQQVFYRENGPVGSLDFRGSRPSVAKASKSWSRWSSISSKPGKSGRSGSGWRLNSGQAVDMSHEKKHSYPIASMYGIFTYIYQKIKPNVDKYCIPYMDGMGTFHEILVLITRILISV